MTIHSHQDDYYEFLIEIPDSVDVPTELPAGHYYLFKADFIIHFGGFAFS